jgi:hypothetical protein
VVLVGAQSNQPEIFLVPTPQLAGQILETLQLIEACT